MAGSGEIHFRLEPQEEEWKADAVKTEATLSL
jgi:hypothetical protein